MELIGSRRQLQMAYRPTMVAARMAEGGKPQMATNVQEHASAMIKAMQRIIQRLLRRRTIGTKQMSPTWYPLTASKWPMPAWAKAAFIWKLNLDLSPVEMARRKPPVSLENDESIAA